MPDYYGSIIKSNKEIDKECSNAVSCEVIDCEILVCHDCQPIGFRACDPFYCTVQASKSIKFS